MELWRQRKPYIRWERITKEMGANNKRPNTFIEYYMWRKRLHFFMKYTPKDQLEQMSVNTLEMIFDAMLNGTNVKA